MKKKFFALILTISMLIGLSACGSEGTKKVEYELSDEPVTITYYYDNGGGGIQQYTQQVQEKLNEILKTIKGCENISIELHPSSSHQRDLNLAMASGEKVDLVSTWGLDVNQMCTNGDFLELEGLLEQFPNTVKEIPDWIVDYGVLFGKQYYIPTYQQVSNLPFFSMPKEYYEMYKKYTGKSDAEISKLLSVGTLNDKLDFLENLCYAVRKETGSSSKWIFPEYNWAINPNYLSSGYFNQEYIGNKQFGQWIMREGKNEPEYFGYTEDFKTIQKRYADWYQKGLLHPDCTSISHEKFTGANFLNDSSYVNLFSSDSCSEKMEDEYLTKLYGIDMKTIRVTEHAYVPSEWEAGGHAICTDCEHPAEAMKIIELLRTKEGKEFYNTLVYGLEGIHWEWADKANDKITTLEFDSKQGGSATCTYSNYKWSTGNIFNAWNNQSYVDGFNEYIVENIEKSKDTVFSPAKGITWDFSNVENQLIQVTSVESEYKRTIYTADDWEKRYNEYIQKLEAAGIKDILKELNRQYKDIINKK